jgi:hypothetical protein
MHLVGCAHWGTLNVAERVPDPPTVTSTYLAPPRLELPADTEIRPSAQPPPPGSTVIAISSAHCRSTDDECLQALVDETRRLGGNGLYGVHPESGRRGSSSMVGSVTFDDRLSSPPPLVSETRLLLQPKTGAPAVDVFLERKNPQDELAFWQLVCKLPCSTGVDADSSYRLRAPALPNEKPLALDSPFHERLRVTVRPGKPDYSRFWWGLGITLFSGAVTGGTTAYFAASKGSSAGVAELTVGLSILPCLFVGIEDMLLGPVNRVELAVEPDG